MILRISSRRENFEIMRYSAPFITCELKDSGSSTHGCQLVLSWPEQKQNRKTIHSHPPSGAATMAYSFQAPSLQHMTIRMWNGLRNSNL